MPYATVNPRLLTKKGESVELTKEYFDQRLDEKLEGFVTKEYLDEKLKDFATKTDLEEIKQGLTEVKDALEKFTGSIVGDIQNMAIAPLTEHMSKVNAVLRLENVKSDAYIVRDKGCTERPLSEFEKKWLDHPIYGKKYSKYLRKPKQ